MDKAIIEAKQKHWTDYLEEASAKDLWTVNRYLKELVGDGSKSYIPMLRVNEEDGTASEITTNEEKAEVLHKPAQLTVPANYIYLVPLPLPDDITKDQIQRHVKALSPYKASSPDGIPNIVLQKMVDIIEDYLNYIYRAIIRLGLYVDTWKEFTTIVLRKRDKPNYENPKAYRPTALLCTLAKILTAIVAEDISNLVEKENLLPENHFGGRPGWMTTDAIHTLVDKIKNAWRRGKVISILFLNVEGAFPNAVTDRLIHNL